MLDQPTVPKPMSKANDGFSGPIADPGDQPVPEHIHPDTLMAKGIDPDTKELVTVSLAVLRHQHGDDKALDIYTRVARAGGFGDPTAEAIGSDFLPDLSLEGMDEKKRAKVDTILGEK